MRLLLTGASGQLGSYLLREGLTQGKSVVAWGGRRSGELFGHPVRPVDLADPDAVASAFRAARPDVVIHTAAMATLADCRKDPEQAERVNVRGTAVLAALADESKARLVHVSTDMVFDGERAPYREEDAVCPLSVYGRTKAVAEGEVLARPGAVVVRLPLLFGPSLVGRPTFFDQQLSALREGRSMALFHDEWRTPLSLPVAARALLALAVSDYPGLLHVGGPQRLSRLEMGRRLALFFRLDPSLFLCASRVDAPGEPRPCDLSLDSSRWRSLLPRHDWPSWEESLVQFGLTEQS